MEAQKNVLVLDNEWLMLSAVSAILSPYYHVHTARTSSEMRESLKTAKIEVVLLDLGLSRGDVDGMQLIGELKEQGIKVIILSGKREHIHICKGLGASGFIVKDDAPSSIVDQIERVLQGGHCFPDDLVNDRAHKFSKTVASLTHKEKIVFDMYIMDLTYEAIALHLNRSANTIKNHGAMILSKFGLTSRSDLIFAALAYRYITIEQLQEAKTRFAETLRFGHVGEGGQDLGVN